MERANDLQSLKNTLIDKGLTLVISSGECYIESTERGVKPLLAILESQKNINGGLAADKVIGKAAAFLYVLLGVKEVYAAVISQPALEVAEKYGIKIFYDKLVPGIINRAGDGPCPMESAVYGVDSPEKALPLIRKKFSELSGNKPS